MVDICKLIDKDKKYYIYGIAVLGKFCHDRIVEKYGEGLIKGFIQTAPKTESFCGKKIYTPEQAAESADDSDIFILASAFPARANQMRSKLLYSGVLENAIISLEDYGFIVKYIPNKQIKSVLVWPAVEKRNLDLSDKIKWFIPDKIQIFVCSSNEEVRSDFGAAENVHFISEENMGECLESADYICVWDAGKLDSGLEAYKEKIHIVDPEFYHLTEMTNYRYLYNSGFSEEEKEIFRQHSLEVFKKMKQEYAGVKRANVFCSGPSIEEVVDNCYKGDYNVICNSMVKDREFLENIHPSMLTFGDLAFYLSPNDYCKAFYKNLLETYEKYHYYIVVYEYEVPLIKNHFPMLYDRLIGVRCRGNYCFPTEEDLYVGGTPNICTLFMVPFASAMCDEIGIAGCTGRNPDENYFWKHNGRTQYLDLMHCVFEAYPSFFKYQDYEDYYDKHCDQTKDLLEYGETQGKSYINMTTSFIQALKDRTV